MSDPGHVRPAPLRDAAWLKKWAPPCPDGNPQRRLQILGFRLKGADYLQLRVVRWSDEGVCQVMTDEHPDRIYVRVSACAPYDPDRPDLWRRSTEALDSGCNWWLDAPLGERIVIDVDTGEELPLYIPRWDTDEPDLYIPRPPGPLWPPKDMPRAG